MAQTLQTIRVLMEGLIDYAGLYPPASLDMTRATENYARYLRSEHAWMLGRFVCSASRLPEFSEKAAMLLPGTHATSGYREHADDLAPWRLSVVIDTDLPDALDIIDACNAHHEDEDHGLAVIDSIELKAPSASFIDDALDTIADGLTPFFEIDPAQDVRGHIAALSGEDAYAKIRCGGVRPDLIPAPEMIARFIDACAHADVRFKATAGLHHPIRAVQNLTYEPSPPRAMMHGFLNVFLASAFRRALSPRTFDADRVESLLSESDAGSLVFSDRSVRWREFEVDTAALARTRESFALAFGSCSFDEPIADLRELGLLSE